MHSAIWLFRPGACSSSLRALDAVMAIAEGSLLELRQDSRADTLVVVPHVARLLRRAEAPDEVERHVDPGRDAGCGDHLAVVDEAVIRPWLDRTPRAAAARRRRSNRSSPAF